MTIKAKPGSLFITGFVYYWHSVSYFSVFQYSVKIVKAIIYSIRPSATIGACLLMLAAFNPQKGELEQVIALIIATFFGSSFCFIINDIFDRKKDLLNDKKRPIATGLIPLKLAVFISFLFAGLFILATWFLGPITFVLSFLFLFIASIYSFINQRAGLVANLIVAFMISASQWGVGILKPDDFLYLSSLFVLFFTVPREIVLDWLDMPGDKKVGKSSVPLKHSSQTIKSFIAFFLFLSLLPMSFGIYKVKPSSFLFLFLLLTIVASCISFIPFLKRPDEKRALLSVRISHIPYAFLILALFSR